MKVGRVTWCSGAPKCARPADVTVREFKSPKLGGNPVREPYGSPTRRGGPPGSPPRYRVGPHQLARNPAGMASCRRREPRPRMGPGARHRFLPPWAGSQPPARTPTSRRVRPAPSDGTSFLGRRRGRLPGRHTHSAGKGTYVCPAPFLPLASSRWGDKSLVTSSTPLFGGQGPGTGLSRPQHFRPPARPWPRRTYQLGAIADGPRVASLRGRGRSRTTPTPPPERLRFRGRRRRCARSLHRPARPGTQTCRGNGAGRRGSLKGSGSGGTKGQGGESGAAAGPPLPQPRRSGPPSAQPAARAGRPPRFLPGQECAGPPRAPRPPRAHVAARPPPAPHSAQGTEGQWDGRTDARPGSGS